MPARSTLLRTAVAVAALALAAGWGFLHLRGSLTAPSHPIVAQLVANPEKYVGTHIEIYGLVIEANAAARSFLLQDVSQRPLLVDARGLPATVIGDQVEIEGILGRNTDGLVLIGNSLKRVKVLAGGGCC